RRRVSLRRDQVSGQRTAVGPESMPLPQLPARCRRACRRLGRFPPERLRFCSSPGVVLTFCAVCGTSISYEPADAPGQIELTSATFDQAERFPPTREVWIKHRLTWQPLDPALKHYPQGSSSGPTEGAV